MIAIRNRSLARFEPHPAGTNEVFELLLAGEAHWDKAVSNIFFQSRQLAAKAVSENSSLSLIVAALLLRPCQILASGSLQAGDWTPDSLLETGTYEWLLNNFGTEIADSIRMQPYARRLLSTVVPKYFGQLTTDEQMSVISHGGFMSSSERLHFTKSRCHSNAMKITNWIDQGTERYVDLPEMKFFFPFLSAALHIDRTIP